MERRVIGIRGATTASEDSATEVLAATRTLLEEMLQRNNVAGDDLISIFFTATPDISSAFPAAAGRELGFIDVPLFGAAELGVSGAPERCLRILVQCYSDRTRAEVRHIYTGGATVLRTDLADQG
jgi:chorismate mutase